MTAFWRCWAAWTPRRRWSCRRLPRGLPHTAALAANLSHRHLPRRRGPCRHCRHRHLHRRHLPRRHPLSRAGQEAGEAGGGDGARDLPAGGAAGGDGRLPCLRTAPHLPPSGPSQGSGGSHTTRSPTSAAWKRAVAPVARLGPSQSWREVALSLRVTLCPRRSSERTPCSRCTRAPTCAAAGRNSRPCLPAHCASLVPPWTIRRLRARLRVPGPQPQHTASRRAVASASTMPEDRAVPGPHPKAQGLPTQPTQPWHLLRKLAVASAAQLRGAPPQRTAERTSAARLTP